MRSDLPSGTVTFLFTDVEGSTRLLHELGVEAYAEALAEHRSLIREACAAEGGVEVDTQGDAFFFAFPTAPGALRAGRALTEALAGGEIQVRVGLHTGTPLLTGEGYAGDDVHRAARIAASAHGGQIVLSAATATLAGPSGLEPQVLPLLDLGEHRLKDVDEPVPIFQLGEESFPPLKTISNTNLPRPASSFVGRERELAEVVERIGQGARLVTLTGPGGSGKTRLALEAAATLVPAHKAGVFWVGLAGLRDPALVTETIAQVLGAKNGLAEHVGEREMLLLLDNLEQVIEAAPELSDILEACPNLILLVTSRELLRVRGEVEYPVSPLASGEAVALFCARSGLEPSEEIEELCARLDNLPLAVELAAARTKALTVSQILERLSQRLDLLKGGRDADPRQQTLRATIEWSHDLLSETEQQLFARLSVFAGGCTLEAAEEVAGANLDLLQSLVDKSLLRFTEGRFWMLETIREYAGERLGASGERDALRDRHAAHFLSLVEESVSHIGGGSLEATWLARLEAERENLRTSLAWSREVDPLLGLRIAAALVGFWNVRGPIGEARTWLETLLGVATDVPLELEARVLPWVADWALLQGDHERAELVGEASLEAARRLNDPMAIGRALHDLAEVAERRGDYPRARSLFEQAIAAVSEVGYEAPGSVANLALIALNERDYERAGALFSRALAIFREEGKDAGAAATLSNLAAVERRRFRHAEALALLEESIGLSRQLGYGEVTMYCLLELSALLVELGDAEQAACALVASDALREAVGIVLGSVDEDSRAEIVAAVRVSLGEAACAGALARGREMPLDQVLGHSLRRAREAVARSASTSEHPPPALDRSS